MKRFARLTVVVIVATVCRLGLAENSCTPKCSGKSTCACAAVSDDKPICSCERLDGKLPEDGQKLRDQLKEIIERTSTMKGHKRLSDGDLDALTEQVTTNSTQLQSVLNAKKNSQARIVLPKTDVGRVEITLRRGPSPGEK